MNSVLPTFAPFNIVSIIGTCLSIVFSLGLIMSLRNKKSNYSRIMRHILMSESIFIFAEMMIVSGYTANKILCEIFNILTFDVLKFDVSCDTLRVANISAYYGNQAFSLLLNIFICLEIILILKNPISQMKSRLKPYFLVSTLTGLLVFFLSFSSISDIITAQSYSLNHIFIAKVPIYINFIIYIIFVFIGFISLVYLFVRFCLGKPLLQNLKNIFVIRHFTYVILYILLFLPNKVNEFLVILGKDKFLFIEFGIIVNIFLGFVMFLIRVSETNFYNRIFCYKRGRTKRKETVNVDVAANPDSTALNQSDLSKEMSNEDKEDDAFFERDQPLTAIISRNMNLEFMCCILFGLTEIFMKPERKYKMSADANDKDLTVTLFPQNSAEKSLLNSTSKGLSNKDFFRARSHQIRYKKIFNSDIDFEKLEVEVISMAKKKKLAREGTIESSSIFDADSLTTEENKKSGSLNDHDAIVIEYCPKLFRELRKIDDISGYDLEKALNPVLNKESMNQVRESEGKSGSFFFFSHDGKFIIKTITNNELNTMLGNFMKNYYEHTSSCPESLLARIYGLYSIVIKGVSKINIILMQNLITIKKNHIKRIFDLKGSRVERITKNIEKCDKLKTLKDLDYLWMIKIEEDMVDFTRDQCEELNETLENDLRVLREVGVMDYSLLLIIIHFPKQTDPDYENIINLFGDKRYCSRIFKSKNMKYIYILGIIDYLQKFNVAKFFENKYKSIVYGNEIKYVSAVDPMIYSGRMLDFARDFIFITHT